MKLINWGDRVFIEEVINKELEIILINKVFPINAPTDTQLPYLTYQANSGENLRSIDGNYSNVFNSSFDIDLYNSSDVNGPVAIIVITSSGIFVTS